VKEKKENSRKHGTSITQLYKNLEKHLMGFRVLDGFLRDIEWTKSPLMKRFVYLI
jgi:hypothetical protein